MSRDGRDDLVEFTIDLVPLSDVIWRVGIRWPDAGPVTVGYLQLQQGKFQMLWIAGDDTQSMVAYESAEAAAAGVARRLLEVMPLGLDHERPGPQNDESSAARSQSRRIDGPWAPGWLLGRGDAWGMGRKLDG